MNDIQILGSTISGERFLVEYPFDNVSANNSVFSEGISETDRNIIREFLEKIQITNGFSFYNCESITSLTFPESLKEIGPGAFENCENLKSVDMPYIEKIGNDAFYECSKLEEIKF